MLQRGVPTVQLFAEDQDEQMFGLTPPSMPGTPLPSGAAQAVGQKILELRDGGADADAAEGHAGRMKPGGAGDGDAHGELAQASTPCTPRQAPARRATYTHAGSPDERQSSSCCCIRDHNSPWTASPTNDDSK